MLQPERYQAPIIEKLVDFQRIERTFSHNAGLEVDKKDLAKAFNEELLELRAELEVGKVNQLALASEIADNILYVLALANFYGFDFEATAAKASGIAVEHFSLKSYADDPSVNNDTSCQESGEQVLNCLQNEVVNLVFLKKALLAHFDNLLYTARENNLSVPKILSRKINRNFYKYAAFKEKLAAGNDFAQARVLTKRAWVSAEEDKKFLRDFFVDYAKPADDEEISHLQTEQMSLVQTAAQPVTAEKSTLVLRSNDREKRLLGYCTWQEKDEAQEKVWQIQEWQAQRMKTEPTMSEQMLEEVENLAREAKCSCLAVETSQENFAWFKNCGFVLTETLKKSGQVAYSMLKAV